MGDEEGKGGEAENRSQLKASLHEEAQCIPQTHRMPNHIRDNVILLSVTAADSVGVTMQAFLAL